MHLNTGTGREEVMRMGGGEDKSLLMRRVRAVCDVCVPNGDKAAVSVDFDTQGSSLRIDQTYFPFNAKVECERLYRKDSWLICAGNPKQW